MEGATLDDIVISSQIVTNFDVEGVSVKIFHNRASLNETDVKKKKFYLPPLLLLKRKDNGDIRYEERETENGLAIQVHVRLIDDDMKANALAKLRTIPEYSSVNVNQLHAITIQRLRVTLQTQLVGVLMEEWNAGDGLRHIAAESVPLVFRLNSPEKIAWFIRQLKHLHLRFFVEITGGATQTNSATVSGQQLINGNLWNNLNGGESDTVLVHRDDLRTILAKTITNLNIVQVLQFDEESAFNSLIDNALQTFEAKFHSEWFTDLNETTFNREDLAPTTMTNNINKLFVQKDQDNQFKLHEDYRRKLATEDVWEAEGSQATDGGLNLGIKLFTFGAKGSHSSSSKRRNINKYDLDEGRTFSREDIQKLMAKHNVETEWNGRQIIARKIKLTRVNKIELENVTNVCSTVYRVMDSQRAFIQDVIIQPLNNTHYASNWNAIATLSNAVQLIQQQLVYYLPIGAILPYTGTTESLPPGFLLLDGAEYDKTNSEYVTLFQLIKFTFTDGAGDDRPKFRVPDLRGKTIFGSNDRLAFGKSIGATDVTLTIANLPSHTHPGTTDAENRSHTHSGTTGDDAPDHSHGIPSSHGHTGSNHRGLTGLTWAGDTTQSQGANTRHRHDFGTGNASQTHHHTFTTGATGEGRSFDILPPAVALNFIIRYK